MDPKSVSHYFQTLLADILLDRKPRGKLEASTPSFFGAACLGSRKKCFSYSAKCTPRKLGMALWLLRTGYIVLSPSSRPRLIVQVKGRGILDRRESEVVLLSCLCWRVDMLTCPLRPGMGRYTTVKRIRQTEI